MGNIIVLGAGAAGLMAASILSKHGKKVTVLEARERIGGRIFTIQGDNFSVPVEAGAEFIHGNLPLTHSLLKKAGVQKVKTEGKTWTIKNGAVYEEDMFGDEWEEFLKLLQQLDHDMPIGEFLRTYLKSEVYKDLRESITRFVQGFDAADPDKASAFALREEWSESADAIEGYHIPQGYSSLIHFLQKECEAQGVEILFSKVVNAIEWEPGQVTIRVDSGGTFAGDCCIVTPPAAVLKKKKISFLPEPANYLNALEKIETGSVIKYIFEFHESFWEKGNKTFRQFSDMQFIFSDAKVPTWWSQRPSHVPILIGWLSGPPAKGVSATDEKLLEQAIQSLGYIFSCSSSDIKEMVRAYKIVNWDADPFSAGAYAYKTVDSDSILKILSEPLEKTIFFAGEAFYIGKEMGTVEAALASGKQAAEKCLSVIS